MVRENVFQPSLAVGLKNAGRDMQQERSDSETVKRLNNEMDSNKEDTRSAASVKDAFADFLTKLRERTKELEKEEKDYETAVKDINEVLAKRGAFTTVRCLNRHRPAHM
jgi:predicted  nucleic acid-binding Zn-ribbon protein